VLLAALAKNGYDASSVYEHATTTLTVPYDGPRHQERERVRRILSEVHESTLGGPDIIYGPVRFEDEPGDDGPRAVPPSELPSARAAAEHQGDPAPGHSTGAAIGLTPLVRAAWGLLLLTGTDTVCRTAAVPPSPRSRLVVRALGARHLASAGVVAAAPSRRTLWIGAGLDSAVALVAIAYAASEPQRRRAGVASGAVAAAFAADGVRRARQAS
jgi:hypothetical protein